jgi:hypothetical protein
VDGKTYSVSFLTPEGVRYESCPVTGTGAPEVRVQVYPNPVRSGEELVVRITASEAELKAAKIQLISVYGNVLDRINAPQEYSSLTMPAVPGIYIVRVFIGNNVKPEELKVIVK